MSCCNYLVLSWINALNSSSTVDCICISSAMASATRDCSLSNWAAFVSIMMSDWRRWFSIYRLAWSSKLRIVSNFWFVWAVWLLKRSRKLVTIALACADLFVFVVSMLVCKLYSLFCNRSILCLFWLDEAPLVEAISLALWIDWIETISQQSFNLLI